MEPEGRADVEDDESKTFVAPKTVRKRLEQLKLDDLLPLLNQNIEIMAFSLFEKRAL